MCGDIIMKIKKMYISQLIFEIFEILLKKLEDAKLVKS